MTMQGPSRRKFIKNAGYGLLATTAAGAFNIHAATLPEQDNINETDPVKFTAIKHPSEKQDGETPSPRRPSKRIGYAIVGLGRLSLNQILPALSKCKHSKPTALVSGDAAKAKKVALQYGIAEKNIYNYSNFDDIKNNPDIEAVYIVLPNSMHEEFTVRAAKAGKHVLCEKPMATSSASATRMIDACKAAGRKLMIAYRVQYNPPHLLLQKWVRSSSHGKVRIINTFNGQNIGDPQQWRLKKALSGGGSLPDLGIYNLNTVRFLLGDEPESVLATTFTTAGDKRFTEVEETVMFQLFFPNGVITNNTCGYGIHESRYYRCHADNGATFGANNAFSYGGLQLELSEVKDNMEYLSHPSAGHEEDQFQLEIDHFSECVRDNKTPYTPGEEGLQDMVIIEAIYESARTGKKVMLKTENAKDPFRGSPPKDKK
jgi:predicted dehydrogenase